MSQTVITTAFEQLKAQQAATGAAVVLDGFIFANVPNLDITSPIDPAEAIPPAAQIVHRADVSLTGVVNENAVVYSVTLGTAVGDFDFNWVGLVNKASNTLAMIVHAPVQNKVANASGVQGNVLTRSFLMEYDGAKKETQITTPAATWQIDFTARLGGMDERVRLENVDIYGAGAFLGDGFLVKKSGSNYSVTAGSGYVGGLRATISADQALTVSTKPVKVWVDTSFTGTLTSTWQVQTAVTVADTLADYVKNGVQHYVFAVAQINADDSVTDLRPQGTLDRQQSDNDFLRKSGGEMSGQLRLKNVSAGYPLQLDGLSPTIVMADSDSGLKVLVITDGTSFRIQKNDSSGPEILGWSEDIRRLFTTGDFEAEGYINAATSVNENGIRVYSPGNKPKPADVDAVSASNGGTFKNAIRIENVSDNSPLHLDGAAPTIRLHDADTDKTFLFIVDGTGFRFTEDSSSGATALSWAGGRLSTDGDLNIGGSLSLRGEVPIIEMNESDTGKKILFVMDGSSIRLQEDNTIGRQIFAWNTPQSSLSTDGSFSASGNINAAGLLQEKDQRVYSPNNPPPFVNSVRRGGRVYQAGTYDGTGMDYEAPAGCFLTGINTKVADGRGMGVYYRALQINIPSRGWVQIGD